MAYHLHGVVRIIIQLPMMNEILRLQKFKKLKLKDLNESTYNDVFSFIQKSLGVKKPRQILFHAAHPEINSIPKCQCGNEVNWHDDHRRYRVFCSKSCTAKYTVGLKKEKNKKKLGVDWHSKSADWLLKTKQTNLNKYGVTHYSKTPEFLRRIKSTNLEKFGVEHPAQSPVVIDKVKQQYIEKYGVDNPAKNTEVKKKSIQSCVERYGVDNFTKINYSDVALNFLSDDILFSKECQNLSVRALAKKYNISTNPIYTKANKLGIIFPKHFSSEFEEEVYQYIVSEYPGTIVRSDRNILINRQLDIYLPDLKLAIECNGTYWHTERMGRHKQYHNDKTNRCLSKGINLIHIWEHDWSRKRDILKSILKSKLKKTNRVFARNTEVRVIDSKTAHSFFTNNHFQGPIKASFTIGLYENNILLAAMSFGKSRFNKNIEWELLRFACKLEYTVVGGASKLFNFFIVKKAPTSVISYADRQISTGNMYSKLKFTHMGHSAPSYKYTKNYVDVFSRFIFQKHKLSKLLPSFNAKLSEAENVKLAGYDKIWDCGNEVYIWKPQIEYISS